MKNVTDTLHAQYANSPTITALIDFVNQAVDPSADLDKIRTMFFDLNTAIGYGLDCWGKIVDVPRNLTIPSSDHFLGFSEAASGAGIVVRPFNDSPFYTGASGTLNFPLEDSAYRRLILAKAMTNISDCTIPSMNKILSYLFKDRGKIWVKTSGSLAMQIVVGFTLTPIEIGILVYSNAIPSPAGVSLSVVYSDGSSPV